MPPPAAGVGAYSTDDSQLLRSTPAHPGLDGAAARTAQVGAVDQAAASAPVKRKRGRPPKHPGGPPRTVAGAKTKKEEEAEAVCFICFHGGSLVACDRRGCPKVYHPACVGRNAAFFRTKDHWHCGRHICDNCKKTSSCMCYTCTYALCKQCIRDANILCVTKNMGFCETCYETVMLIEAGEDANLEKVGIDFDDKSSWNYLFKLYWLALKEKLHLTVEELSNVECPWKSSGVSASNEESSDELYIGNAKQDESPDSSSVQRECRKRNRRCLSKHVDIIIPAKSEGHKMKYLPEERKWASPELLEFTAHMRNGDISVLTEFDVQALLLEYIKRNNLHHPHKGSQIICDTMLQNLFHKQCVGHFEMLKLLESHFLIKEASQIGIGEKQDNIDADSGQMDAEDHFGIETSIGSDKKRKFHKKLEERDTKNINDYAAINTHNINLIYLRRNLLEVLIDDSNAFKEKVTGAFVRIRIPSAGSKQDNYRLVKIIGTHVVAEKYKVGKKTTNMGLDILNLDKAEKILIDSVSNQDFTEEECRRLRQSMKCGLINRLTVGDALEKAKIFQAVRVNDWLESEKLRLCHLRGRASETGRRKELRECVEKLQLLSTPEEHMRRLNDLPEIHVDAHMDPNYESPEELDANNGDNYKRLKESSSRKKAKDLWSPGRGSISSYNWRDAEKSADTRLHSNKRLPKDGFQDNLGLGDKMKVTFCNVDRHLGKPEGSCGGSPGSLPYQVQSKTNVADRVWHYLDPSGNIQGPFSVIQLRQWSSIGYFPPDLSVWLTSQKQEDSILLTDVLVKAEKDAKQEVQQNKFTQHGHFTDRVDTRNNHLDCSLKGNNDLTSVDISQNGTQRSKNQGSATPTLGNYVTVAERWAPPLSATYDAPQGKLLNTQSGNAGKHQRDSESSLKDTSSAVSVEDSGWNVTKQLSSAKIHPVQTNEPADNKRVTESCKASAAQSLYASLASTPLSTERIASEKRDLILPCETRKLCTIDKDRKPNISPSTNSASGCANKYVSDENTTVSSVLKPVSESRELLLAPICGQTPDGLKSGPLTSENNLIPNLIEVAESNFPFPARTYTELTNPEGMKKFELSIPLPAAAPAPAPKASSWDVPSPTPESSRMKALASCDTLRASGSPKVETSMLAESVALEHAASIMLTRNRDPEKVEKLEFGQHIKGKENPNWESTAQDNGRVAWGKRALRDTNVKRPDSPGHLNMNANSSCGTPTPGGTELNSGWEAQPRRNMNNCNDWGQAIKDKVNANRASTTQASGEVTSEKPALQDKNVKIGLNIPGHVNIDANSSCGTPTPGGTEVNSGWEAQPRRKMNNYNDWGQVIKDKVNANRESTTQASGEVASEKPALQDKNVKIGLNIPGHVNINANSSCGMPTPGGTKINSGWEAQTRGNMNNYDGWGQAIKDKMIANWASTTQESGKVIWEKPELRDKNVKTTCDIPGFVNMNANSSCGAPAPGKTKENSGWDAQPRENMNKYDGWGQAIKGKANTNWEQESGEVIWALSSLQDNAKTGWDMPGHVNISANSSCGTPEPGRGNLISGWEAQPRGNINNHDSWRVSAPGHNKSSGWELPREVKPNLSSWDAAIQENERTQTSWGTWKVEHAREDVGWNKPEKQENSDASSDKIGEASMENANWNSRRRNFDSPGRGRYDRDRHEERSARDSRYRSHSMVGGPSHQGLRGVCKFYANGHCRRGSTCRYLHQ